ncbi:hypothetical protein BB561_001728 [Smittium simulii]|uniref:BHLH domain-containing protein n=1 Tax=Smittium simulii TaxID=133385 RepID=A0A2T9YTG1_9FUNG|nr:hypothetical protein BB561_001728 [Smittium simulii]
MNTRLPSNLPMLDEKQNSKRIKFSDMPQNNYQEKLNLNQMNNFINTYGHTNGDMLLNFNDDMGFENKKLSQMYEGNFNLSNLGVVNGMNEISAVNSVGNVNYGQHIGHFNQFGEIGNSSFNVPGPNQQRMVEDSAYFRLPFEHNNAESSPGFYQVNSSSEMDRRFSEGTAKPQTPRNKNNHNTRNINEKNKEYQQKNENSETVPLQNQLSAQNQPRIENQIPNLAQNQHSNQAQSLHMDMGQENIQGAGQVRGYRNENFYITDSNQMYSENQSQSRINDHVGNNYDQRNVVNNEQMHYLNGPSNFAFGGQFGPHSLQLMGLMGSESSGLNQKAAISILEKKQRRRESHNAVERRRRDNINDRIQELYTLLPESMKDAAIKPNKGLILNLAVEYIKKIQAGLDHTLLTKSKDGTSSNSTPINKVGNTANTKAKSSGSSTSTSTTSTTNTTPNFNSSSARNSVGANNNGWETKQGKRNSVLNNI